MSRRRCRGWQGERGLRLSRSAPLGQVLAETIHAGEVESLIELLRKHLGLASARIVDDKGGSGTPLHMAADWPGFFPRGPQFVAALITAAPIPALRWTEAGTLQVVLFRYSVGPWWVQRGTGFRR